MYRLRPQLSNILYRGFKLQKQPFCKSKRFEPADLILIEDVEMALKADKGSEASTIAFRVENFTKPGDNHACHVTSVKVQYALNDKVEQTSYIAKVISPVPGKVDGMNLAFAKETGFFKTILPQVNKYLKSAGEPCLRVPAHYHSVETRDEQVIYLEDMRRRGFKMTKREETLDKDHTVLIIRELARLHAASSFLISETENEKGISMTEEFPMLVDVAKQEIIPGHSMLMLIASGLLPLCNIFKTIPDYRFVYAFVSSRQPNLVKLLTEMFDSKSPFRVIGHGDSWKNNFLFRYDEDGSPAECCILDYQVSRISSVANDLNLLLFSGLDGDLRKKEMETFLDAYHASFSNVLSGLDCPMSFSKKELREEFAARHLYGFTWTMMTIPSLVLNPKEIPSLIDFFGQNGKKMIEKYQDKIAATLSTSEVLRPRILDMVDQMRENGMFEEFGKSRESSSPGEFE